MKRHLLIISLIGCCAGVVRAQDISAIAGSNPLIITGAIGTQNTFYNSSYGGASPMSNMAYVNLNVNLYGFSMPFSFYWSNDNTSFSYPQFSFNVSPSYKGWTLHMGRRSMSFSSYICNIPFNGVGLEYRRPHGAGLRFGAFYGTLRKAVNVRPDEYVTTLSPQYRRTGWGVKVGYGSSRNYLDLYFFRAKDHQSSIDACWYDELYAQDNLVAGARGRLTFGEHFTLSANVASSLISTDTRADVLNVDAVRHFDKIFDVRYSSLMRFAGDATIGTYWKHFSAAVSYRLVQPEYNSLGLSYISNNYHSLAISTTANVKRLSLSANFSGQADNLSGQQLFTTKGYIYSASATWALGQHFNLAANYSGYWQTQSDGTMHVTDSTRIDRRMDNFSIMPSYEWRTQLTRNTLSFTGSYTSNRDLNPHEEFKTDVHTSALGANYRILFTPVATSLGMNYSHQNSDGYGTRYNTDIISLSLSRSFLEDKNLSLSATGSVIRNRMNQQSANNSLGGMLSAAYILHQHHSFNFSAGYNRYITVNLIADENQRNENYCFQMSLAYNYTFTLLELKKKGEKRGRRK